MLISCFYLDLLHSPLDAPTGQFCLKTGQIAPSNKWEGDVPSPTAISVGAGHRYRRHCGQGIKMRKWSYSG